MRKTLKHNPNPMSRITVGDVVLAAAETTRTEAVAKELAAFAEAHRDYAAAEAAVEAARAAKRAQEERVAELDLDQDAAIDKLAAAATADGLPKGNPFKPLDASKPVPPPATLKRMQYAKEAEVVRRVVWLLGRRKDLSARTRDEAKAADAAAANLLGALAAVPALEGALREATARREALAQPWETALARLKLGARYADQTEGAKLYATLFQSQPAKPAKAKAAKTAKASKAQPTTGDE